ncbi:proteasome assembly chaperone family protein [Candidatus Micrarchaeota archaeon]|nr:proteasome assembly chaperone family protein [Candidatus Micrarchaeota archaeon]
MAGVEIHTNSRIKKLKKPTIIIGFPGTGLVGSVAASQIVDSLNMEFGGHISSPDFAPLAAIHDYKPLPAARIHFSEKDNLIIIISEMTIPVSSSSELADKIFQFSKAVDAASIISLGGISLNDEQGEVYIVSSDREMIKLATSKKFAKPIREGATTGVTGILLTKGTLERFPITTILAESSEEYLDPKAASRVIKVLSRIIELPISTSKLDREARAMSEDIKTAVKKAKISKKGPSSYEGGTMYG